MENTTFVDVHGTRLSRVPVTAAWKQRAVRLLAPIPTDDNSTGVSATGRCRR